MDEREKAARAGGGKGMRQASLLVKMDLFSVTFMDSSGIAVLLQAKRQMVQRMKKVAIYARITAKRNRCNKVSV